MKVTQLGNQTEQGMEAELERQLAEPKELPWEIHWGLLMEWVKGAVSARWLERG
jgi:hypothetical protein